MPPVLRYLIHIGSKFVKKDNFNLVGNDRKIIETGVITGTILSNTDTQANGRCSRRCIYGNGSV